MSSLQEELARFEGQKKIELDYNLRYQRELAEIKEEYQKKADDRALLVAALTATATIAAAGIGAYAGIKAANIKKESAEIGRNQNIYLIDKKD